MSEESIQREDFEIAFDKACKFVQKNPTLFEEPQMLKLYGLFKLATVGKCNVPEPSMFSWKRKEMWKVWKDLESKNIKNPHQMYVDYLTSLVENWEDTQ